MVCSLSFFAVVREASEVCPAAVRVLALQRRCASFQVAPIAIWMASLDTPVEERKVLDPDPRLIKNPAGRWR